MKASLILLSLLMITLASQASDDTYGESTTVDLVSIQRIDKEVTWLYKINAGDSDEMIMNCSGVNGSLKLKDENFEFSDVSFCKETARKLKEGQKVTVYLSYLSKHVHFDE